MKKVINQADFIKDSKELVQTMLVEDLLLSREKFEEYKINYKENIFDSQSKFYQALPFYKSVEEFLYNPLAKEKGFVSIEEIQDFLENDILSLK